MDYLTDHLDFIIKTCTAAGGLYLFFRGVIEYRNSNRTKQAEFLEKLIAGFASPELSKAIKILDDYYFHLMKKMRQSLEVNKSEKWI